ncbi:MAG: hypothetical protein PVG89_16210 [Gammaproteobacteria bacterium]|jgi:hypothetical protein
MWIDSATGFVSLPIDGLSGLAGSLRGVLLTIAICRVVLGIDNYIVEASFHVATNGEEWEIVEE